MTDELDRALERARQNRQAQDAPLSRAAATGVSRPVVSGSTLCAGDRVFDLVSGKEGAIEGAALNTTPGDRLVFVRAEDGTLYARALEDLVKRPNPPGVP